MSEEKKVITKETLLPHFDTIIAGVLKIKEAVVDDDLNSAEYIAMETTRILASTQWALSLLHNRTLEEDGEDTEED